MGLLAENVYLNNLEEEELEHEEEQDEDLYWFHDGEICKITTVKNCAVQKDPELHYLKK